MRISTFVLAAVLFSPVALTSAAAGQNARPSCDGMINIVRVSDIKPGMMDTFLKAVAAQKAWYKQAGTKDEISVMRIADMKTGAYSETEAITTHTSMPNSTPAKHDAGYDAFVALFTQSSTIKTQYLTCMK